MTMDASGNFDVELSPEATFGGGIGRFSLKKVFRGGIEGVSVGEMLVFRTATPGSAGYVLIEQVTATMQGRAGSFKLQHHGLMNRGEPELSVTVIPDSGTGDLFGISGAMSIDAADDHAYLFTYDLPVLE